MLDELLTPTSKANLGFILLLMLFSYFWLRFSSGLTLKLFRPIYQTLKSRKKLGLTGLFKLGLYFQTTLLMMSYALFLVLIPSLLDLLYGNDLHPPTSMIALSIILFFCSNWILGLRRWDLEIDRNSNGEELK